VCNYGLERGNKNIVNIDNEKLYIIEYVDSCLHTINYTSLTCKYTTKIHRQTPTKLQIIYGSGSRFCYQSKHKLIDITIIEVNT
jgi:hypothetical protein